MVPPVLTQKLGEMAPRYGIRLAIVFGSTVSGRQHERSDLDLAIVLEEPSLDIQAFAELQHELQAAVPDRELDLAVINHADPLFLHQITSACELAHGSARDLQSLKLYAFRRHQDHRRYLEMERGYVRRFVDGFGAAS